MCDRSSKHPLRLQFLQVHTIGSVFLSGFATNRVHRHLLNKYELSRRPLSAPSPSSIVRFKVQLALSADRPRKKPLRFEISTHAM